MAAATDYLEAAVLDHVLGNTAFTQPTTLYIGLFTTATADDGTGTEVGAGVNYSRQTVAFGAATTVAGVSTASNSADVEFGPATVSNWGTISHLAIFDAASGGNMLFHGALSVAKTITVDDSLRIGTGNLTIELQ